ncbi:MAG: metabolite traffic protein EboE, partial [Candidatus Binatia bacterium]
MRIRFPDGRATVLTYCTNVHPIESLEEARAALARYCGPVARRLGTSVLSLGLWLSRRSSSALVESSAERERFRGALAENGLEVVTLNAFPYGNFHAERVKENVYLPDWTDPRRYQYTLDLATILGELLPAGVGEGTISTLPLGYVAHGGSESIRVAAEALARLAGELER